MFLLFYEKLLLGSLALITRALSCVSPEKNQLPNVRNAATLITSCNYVVRMLTSCHLILTHARSQEASEKKSTHLADKSEKLKSINERRLWNQVTTCVCACCHHRLLFSLVSLTSSSAADCSKRKIIVEIDNHVCASVWKAAINNKKGWKRASSHACAFIMLILRSLKTNICISHTLEAKQFNFLNWERSR